MAKLFTIIWGRSGETLELIPIDEDKYGATPERAKELARGLLAKAVKPKLMPLKVLEISQEKLDEMVNGTTPLHTFNQGEDQEFEMLELRP